MVRVSLLVLVFTAALFGDIWSKAFGQTVRGWDDVSRAPIYLLEDVAENPTTLVYNGTRSVDGEFEPMGWIGNCTGTLVGPQVIFTASHCVSTGSRITFSHRGSGTGISAVCTRHPAYNTRTVYNDYAFCKLASPVPEGTQMASFDIVAGVSAGEKLLINGLGAPTVRVHHWGSANVRNVQGQDIVTCGPANLGGGDSGGSLLRWSDDRRKTARFKVLGVNSRGGGGCSYYNRTNHPEFISFARSYETSQNVKLCGISLDCGPPVPPSDPVECKDNAGHLETIKACTTRSMPPVYCADAVKALDKCYEKLIGGNP